MRYAALAALILIAAFAHPAVSAPVPPPYTDDQARRGETLFYEQCAECHGDLLQGHFGPGLANGTDNVQWSTVGYIWGYMTAHMPAGNAGGLKVSEYLDILAFLLKMHGHAPSKTPLTAQAAVASKATFGPP